MHWIPLESNPDVLNQYTSKLKVNSQLLFQDVWGLDAEVLSFIPKPIAAFVLLFPITKAYEEYRKSLNEKIQNEGQTVVDSLYFMEQTIGNACGTIGLLHALANTLEPAEWGSGVFKEIMHRTLSLSPAARAKELELIKGLESIHQDQATQGQTEAPDAEEDVDLHFVCFVEKEGFLYELDGRNPTPINHGPCTDLALDAAAVIKKIMALSPEQVNYTILALAGDPDA